MHTSIFSKAGVLAVIHSLSTMYFLKILFAWEGHAQAFDGNNALWAGGRVMIYEQLNPDMVFTGSSGNKRNLDVQTRENSNW